MVICTGIVFIDTFDHHSAGFIFQILFKLVYRFYFIAVNFCNDKSNPSWFEPVSFNAENVIIPPKTAAEIINPIFFMASDFNG